MNPAMPQARLFKTPYMKYPGWLFGEGRFTREFYTDRTQAQQDYILFFTLKNIECQKELFDRLIDRLNHSTDAYNQYDYSRNSLEYAKSFVLHQVKLWLENFDTLFKDFDQGMFEDFLTVDIVEGTGIKITPSETASDMFNGKVQEDFIVNHPSAELQFHRFILKKKIHEDVRKGVHV